MPAMNLTLLRLLLGQTYSYEVSRSAVEPVLKSISIAARLGIEAVEQSDDSGLLRAANDMTDAYSRL